MPEIKELDFPGVYRGTVVDNYDPLIMGRCKLYVPGIYPASMASDGRKLPWAEPCMSIFGGSFTRTSSGDLNPETGVTSIPHIGAELWTFFENGNHMYPKFFAACQAGSGWMSEHSNQHIIKTDNVRIRIDENPGLSGSTCKFDSYNQEVGEELPLSKKNSFTQKPTRIDIQIQAENCVALNIQIVGDVNMNIKGNVYERIEGDKHETHIGNLYRYHQGDEWVNHDGKTLKHTVGECDQTRNGDMTDTVIGDLYEVADGSRNETVIGSKSSTVYGRNTENCTEDKTFSFSALNINAPMGISFTTLGNITEQCAEKITSATHDITNKSLMGNIVNNALSKGYYTDKDDTKYKFRGGIINEGDYVMNMAQGSIVNAATPEGMVYNQIETNTVKVADMFEAVRDEVRYAVNNYKKLMYPLNPEKWDWQYHALEAVADITGLTVSFEANPMTVTAAPTVKESADVINMEANDSITMTAVANVTVSAGNTINLIED